MKLLEFVKSDLDLLKQIFQSPEVMQYTLEDPYSDEAIEDYLEDILANNRTTDHRSQYEYKVIDQDHFIGFADFQIIRTMPRGGIAEIGYLLLPQQWRKGYASEICKELIRICFEELNLHKVVASCNEDNIGSQRVMEKCGMLCEGRFLNHRYKNGRFANELSFAIQNVRNFPEISNN